MCKYPGKCYQIGSFSGSLNRAHSVRRRRENVKRFNFYLSQTNRRVWRERSDRFAHNLIVLLYLLTAVGYIITVKNDLNPGLTF